MSFSIKGLEWKSDHGVAGLGPYRLFQAETPLGRFSYGTDAEGACYWHSATSGVMMVGTEEVAKRQAEAAWEKMALVEADKFVILAALSDAPARKSDPARIFDKADWYWRTMDPDDCGVSPEEAINRAMIGHFCVCEIASSFTGPVRYGFVAPVLDPQSDDEEFVHFATQEEAIEAAKLRRAASPSGEDA